MGNRICLLFICHLIFFTGVSAQGAYNKFVVDGVSWVIYENYCTQMDGPCDGGNSQDSYDYTNTYYYKLEGDTLLDSVNYEKLWVSFCANSCIGCSPQSGPPFYPGCNPYQLVALLSEDTINKKVYSRSISFSNCWNHYDSLFMNFSLAVGDSQKLMYVIGSCDTNEFIVDSINYTGFQNYHVKTWYIRNSVNVDQGWGLMQDIQLYEGIGYSYGFNLMYDQGDGTGYGRQLIQYCAAGDNSCISPYNPNGINEIAVSDLNIVVMPNPAFDFIRINSANATVNKVEILDMNGRMLISSSVNELGIHSLTPAVYLLQIHTNVGIAYKKLVKM